MSQGLLEAKQYLGRVSAAVEAAELQGGRNCYVREIFSKSYYIKPKSDCIFRALIDLERNGRPFGSKSIGAW